jgi:hypothetical protein
MSLFDKVGIQVIRVGFTGLLYILLATASLSIVSCATQNLYDGVEATDLASLTYGMNRNDVEKYIGEALREFQCASGTIVTYIYDRGYVGCVKDGTCDPEKEDALQTFEVVGDVFLFGMATVNIGECINPCQEGHLEIYFDQDDRIIGARELPTDRDDFGGIAVAKSALNITTTVSLHLYQKI